MTEAGLALLSLSFETFGLNQVKAMHSTINPKSGEVMKRLGMKKIGSCLKIESIKKK